MRQREDRHTFFFQQDIENTLSLIDLIQFNQQIRQTDAEEEQKDPRLPSETQASGHIPQFTLWLGFDDRFVVFDSFRVCVRFDVGFANFFHQSHIPIVLTQSSIVDFDGFFRLAKQMCSMDADQKDGIRSTHLHDTHIGIA